MYCYIQRTKTFLNFFSTECGFMLTASTTATGSGSTAVSGISTRLACLAHCQTTTSCKAVTWDGSSCTSFPSTYTTSTASSSTLFVKSCACPSKFIMILIQGPFQEKVIKSASLERIIQKQCISQVIF